VFNRVGKMVKYYNFLYLLNRNPTRVKQCIRCKQLHKKKKRNNNSKCAFKRRKDALYNLKSVACRQELMSSVLMAVLISSGVDG
jgi:Zn-finger protein